ncbi:hypothetical protein Tco_0622585 [Tanacetum coccineum]
MNDPNITMEEYIRLEEEKSRGRGKVYNWETATYAIVFDDAFTSEVTLSSKPTVSPLNDNKIDFRISFDESDDEDYTVIFDKNSFSYKIISVDNLKTDSGNDNDKVNMPSLPSPEPTVSCFDDLDFLKDFENEFPATVYNDALTSKLDSSTESVEVSHRIDEFDLKNEASLSECDEEEQNVSYFNDLFPFNVIFPDDSKSDKDNDDDKIDIKHSSGCNVINTDDGAYAHGSNKLLETSHDTSNKFFKTETFIKELNVNIVAWNYLNKGMLLNLIKNLYVPFGIPFDPKLFYKDGIKLGQIVYTALVDTTYSLNEYSVFEFYRSQYGVSWGMDTAYRLPNLLNENDDVGAVLRVPPYPFSYPTRRLTMKEMLAKFIDEGNVLIPKNEVKGVKTRGGKMTSEATSSKEINETRINKNEPPRFGQDVQKKPHDIGVKNKSSSIPERTTQPLVKPQQSSISFPNQMRKEQEEAHQRNFLENLKQLNINISFIEALVLMPKYAKCLKSLLTNKSRLEEACKVTMNERCSAVLLNKLSSKEKDPRSFTIPCQVDKFVLPIDFVILDMPEDSRILIILGRPFLATTRVMIDVFNKKITLRVGDDEVIFDMDLENLINQSELKSCNSIGDEFDNDSNVDSSIRHIDPVNTPDSKEQETKGTDRVLEKRKQEEDLVVDHLSRLECPHIEVLTDREVADEFPDKRLMLLKSKFNDDEPWFGVPKALISDRGTHFCNSQLEKALQKYGVTHKLSATYHPQSNGQTEVTNKAIKRILKRSVGYNLKDWLEKLNDALRAFRTAYKTPTWCTPFRLVYGKACHLPMEIEHKAHWALKQCNMDLMLARKSRLMQFNELAELRDGAYENTRIYK